MGRRISLYGFRAVIAAIWVAGAPAMAAVIVQPVAVTSDAPIGQNPLPDFFPIANLLNQTGLSETYESGVTDFDDYVDTVIVGNALEDVLGIGSFGTDEPFDVDFDLGESYAVSGIALFNLVGGVNQLTQVELYGAELADFSDAVDLGAYAVSTNVNALLFPELDARYIRLTVLQNGGGAESSFYHLAARTPEPGTALLVTTGLSMLAAARRRGAASP